MCAYGKYGLFYESYSLSLHQQCVLLHTQKIMKLQHVYFYIGLLFLTAVT
jgi:hypothetical protein